MEGKVKWYNVKKGYGFIAGNDSNEYFVHFTGLTQGTKLYTDDVVQFEPVETEKGLQAQQVSKPEGQQGSEEASEGSPQESSDESAEDQESEGEETSGDVSSEESDETDEGDDGSESVEADDAEDIPEFEDEKKE